MYKERLDQTFVLSKECRLTLTAVCIRLDSDMCFVHEMKPLWCALSPQTRFLTKSKRSFIPHKNFRGRQAVCKQL